jgi:hypothetical protein
MSTARTRTTRCCHGVRCVGGLPPPDPGRY